MLQFKNVIQGKKEDFLLFDFLFWIILAIIFPVAGKNFGLTNVLRILIYFSATYYAGELLIKRIEIIRKIPFLLRTGIYMLAGSIFCGAVFLFISSGLVIYFFAILLLIDIAFRKNVRIAFSWKHFICLIPLFAMLFQRFEIAYSLHKTYTVNGGDYYFYTGLVETIKTNHSVTDAVYHAGLPINYSFVPYLAPAQLASFAGISSQFALWGVFSKIIPVICFGSLSYCIVKIYQYLFNVTVDGKSFHKKLLLASCMLMFLGPIHVLNLVHADFKSVLFLGEGYLLPLKSLGFAISMCMSALIMLIVLAKDNLDLYDKFGIVIFIAIIAGSKIALYLPIGVLLGIISIFRLYKKQSALFNTLVIALPVSLLMYHLTVGAKDRVVVNEISSQGYYQMSFYKLALKYHIHGSQLKMIITTMLISVFMWLSIKLFVSLIAGLNFFKANYKAVTLLISGLLTFVFSMLPGFFVNSYGKDSGGTFVFDDRYNMAHFTRAGIFLLAVITGVFALYLMYNHSNLLVRRLSVGFIFLWMLPVAYSFFAGGEYIPERIAVPSWYKEVEHDFFSYKPALMAMMGTTDKNGSYRGQVISQGGVHPWFCTGNMFQDGYIMTQRALDRNKLFQKIFDSTLLLPVRTAAADSLKRAGVDCLVASPLTISAYDIAEKNNLISKIPGAKWFYRFN